MALSHPGIESIGQIALLVKDLERARAFYRDTLGLPHLFDAPPGMSFFRCGNLRLMLGLREGPGKDSGSSIVYYRASPIEGAHAALAAAGVAVQEPPRFVAPMPDHDLWLAFYRDSEGNAFALMDEKQRG
jgi:methylmalonyl-CoA/ethylmalonyl-CoA epimerase